MPYEGLKLATGTYLNLFSEQGYNNFGLKTKIDIFIVLPEHMGNDINLDEVGGIAQTVIKDFAKCNGSLYELSDLKCKLENALIDFETQVIVNSLPI